LVGYWNFEEGQGTTAYDQTANGNNGTINGATYDTNVPPQSCSPTNINGCPHTGPSLASNNELSAVWFTGAKSGKGIFFKRFNIIRKVLLILNLLLPNE
jgi:hypothetical protein